MTTRRTLTPVNITEKYPSFRTGRLEIWAAESRDGIWSFKRDESPGTPWIAEHLPTGGTAWYGTLTAARAATAGGDARRDLGICPDCDARNGGHNAKCPALAPAPVLDPDTEYFYKIEKES